MTNGILQSIKKIGITSRMGSFKAFLVSLNLVSSFSSCLDKTLMMVAELRISSSTFSSLPTKPTTTPSLFALQILRHCLQRITLPTTTAPTSSEYCKTKILLPNDIWKPFDAPGNALLARTQIEHMMAGATQSTSATKRSSSKPRWPGISLLEFPAIASPKKIEFLNFPQMLELIPGIDFALPGKAAPILQRYASAEGCVGVARCRGSRRRSRWKRSEKEAGFANPAARQGQAGNRRRRSRGVRPVVAIDICSTVRQPGDERVSRGVG